MKQFLVSDWMTRDAITAKPHDGMLTVHRLMRANNIRRMPVVNKKGELVGIVTRSDVREAQPSDASTLNVWEMNYLLAKLTLEDIMTRDVITIRADDTIEAAAILLHDNRIGALPVVDERKHVVGILTESDIFRALIAWFGVDHPEAATARTAADR